MKTRQQFKVKDYEGFKEAMKVYDFKNPRVADERFKELGYRYVTKFPTHIDISQKIEHYEEVDNPLNTLFDEDTGLHYIKEREEGVDWDNVSDNFEEFKKSGLPMEVLVSNATKFMTQKEFMDKLNADVKDDFTTMLSEQKKNLDRDLEGAIDDFKKEIKKTEKDPIKPKHYEILGMEVKDINEELLNKIQASDFYMSLNEAGWYQQAMQYFFRFYAKNGVEDLEKGIEAMKILVTSLKSGE